MHIYPMREVVNCFMKNKMFFLFLSAFVWGSAWIVWSDSRIPFNFEATWLEMDGPRSTVRVMHSTKCHLGPRSRSRASWILISGRHVTECHRGPWSRSRVSWILIIGRHVTECHRGPWSRSRVSWLRTAVAAFSKSKVSWRVFLNLAKTMALYSVTKPIRLHSANFSQVPARLCFGLPEVTGPRRVVKLNFHESERD